MAWLGISRDTFTRSSVKGDYKWYYDVENVGFKYNGNALMAAVGLVSLRYLDEDNTYRRQICSWYDEYLANAPGIEHVEQAEGCEGSRHLYQVLVSDRDAVLQSLYENGIFPGVHYRDNTEYKMYGYAHGTLPNTAYMSDHVISLPLHMNLAQSDVERVATALKQAVRA
jgi:dTDP-4-amino-4,6-dideoxygalactose transaminase